ncbi:hypothetical protein [Snodgrassella alvi]|uniref:hypothetical protein n=1 Tax=Snodgrassella alvi TaxID=1196083 RepID=UPI002147DD63|nr:hypothetical protein [Snodgrassella alvi]
MWQGNDGGFSAGKVAEYGQGFGGEYVGDTGKDDAGDEGGTTLIEAFDGLHDGQWQQHYQQGSEEKAAFVGQ